MASQAEGLRQAWYLLGEFGRRLLGIDVDLDDRSSV
jgi:hypothetical protein